MRLVIAIVLLLSGLMGCASPYSRGCVAADHETASRAGADMLRRGGNAVDAAVATSFTLSVVRPYSCGIGGGGFMVLHLSPDGRAQLKALGKVAPEHIAINYREMAPAAAGPDHFETAVDPDASTKGGRAVAVPGSVAGLLHALHRYGTMDRADVLAPAIRAAEEGFAADAHYIRTNEDLIKEFQERPELRDRFAFVWRRYLLEGRVKEGDRIRVPEQAHALRLIAEHGAAGFYEGALAAAMVEAVVRDRGAMTLEDLEEYRIAETPPLTADIFGRRFITVPPPSSGGLAMLETLRVFERVMPGSAGTPRMRVRSQAMSRDVASSLGEGPLQAIAIELWRLSPEYAHALAESFKNAFADRSRHLADPAFVHVPVGELLARCTDFAARFNPGSTLPPDLYGVSIIDSARPPEDHGTSHFCVVDGAGSAVSCTETINLEFGSCLAVPEFGFLLNNQMDDFTTRRGQPNAFGLVQSDHNLPAPGKRPLSSMTPTIVLDTKGEVQLVAGASGGPRIITSTTQCILAAIFNPGLSAAAIVAAPRIHHQWLPDILYMEHLRDDATLRGWSDTETGRPFYPDHLGEQLKKRGHEVRPRTTIGEVQMIVRTPDGWDPACDPRKGGKPAGVPSP
jgi:gamma-glutamyltranspeptidase / glutathione hydrolase